MSYPQFNLTTLQLPAPASNMTKAEYKAAYGIDLDDVDIKAFKLVLLGKDKYPIDQIKEVEDGYEIYFNGRILSITDIVQTSDEVYDVANSKPIYYHPIYFTDNENFRIQCTILDNVVTPYTKATFAARVHALVEAGAIINLNGCIRDTDTDSYEVAYMIFKLASNDHRIFAFDNSNLNRTYNFDTIIEAVKSFTDGVNKIN